MNDKELVDFFKSGFYQEFWGWEFNEKESQKIAEKSITLLDIHSGHILDWCGGWGRISLHLAKKGFKITILDFIKEYLIKAKQIFKKNNLALTIINADCRETPSDIQADHAICSFNSVGFLSDDDQIKAFRSLYKALKPKGKIIIDCINQLFIAKHFLQTTQDTRPDGIKCHKKNRFDLKTGVLHCEFEMIDKQGNIKKKKTLSQRIYTPLELRKILENAGFKIQNMFGSFDEAELSFDLPQIITVAVKKN